MLLAKLCTACELVPAEHAAKGKQCYWHLIHMHAPTQNKQVAAHQELTSATKNESRTPFFVTNRLNQPHSHTLRQQLEEVHVGMPHVNNNVSPCWDCLQTHLERIQVPPLKE